MEIDTIIRYLKAEGFEVMNWKPDNRRIFKVLDNRTGEESSGMYSNEFKAWFGGYQTGKQRR